MAEGNLPGAQDSSLPDYQYLGRGAVSSDAVYVPHSKQTSRGRRGRGKSSGNYRYAQQQNDSLERSEFHLPKQSGARGRYSGGRGPRNRYHDRRNVHSAVYESRHFSERGKTSSDSNKIYSESNFADRNASFDAVAEPYYSSMHLDRMHFDKTEFNVPSVPAKEHVGNSRVATNACDNYRYEDRNQKFDHVDHEPSHRGRRAYSRGRGWRGDSNYFSDEKFAIVNSRDQNNGGNEAVAASEAESCSIAEFCNSARRNLGSKTQFGRQLRSSSEQLNHRDAGHRAAPVRHDGNSVPDDLQFHDLTISTVTNLPSSVRNKTCSQTVVNVTKMKKTDPELQTQRGLLIEQLSRGTYECMICYNVVKRETAVWNCSNCYHIYHLYCIKRWANSSKQNASDAGSGVSGWRCPACQNVTDVFPSAYLCFCGKMKDPEFHQYVTPHSCGEVCGRERDKECPHRCNILCHPGPCPPCQAFTTKSCACGKTKQSVRCASAAATRCDKVCERTRNCGKHSCQSICHSGPCDPCLVTVTQTCCCGKETRSVVCGSQESFDVVYLCIGVCGRSLDCGHHSCEQLCHPGPCDGCRLTPEMLTHCPCGKTALVNIPTARPRLTCTDDIPTCQLKCLKRLSCGTAENRHLCQRPCHSGACGPCSGMTQVECRCGAQTIEMSCSEFVSSQAGGSGGGYTCDRRCNKKMSCGRHKCGQYCCVSADHQCRLICGYKLPCGSHKCEEPCHRGKCPPCWQVSFDELRCHCGAEVIYPPVACGTAPPPCSCPCVRPQACGHRVQHTCHAEAQCPPCPVLTQKWCHGQHELRSNIPCYVAEISCGLACNKALLCAVHKCIQTCHKGECPPCSQPCPSPRADCGHPCQAPCHPGSECPPTPCKTEITVRCECGRREERVLCMQGASNGSRDAEYNKAAAQAVASRLWEKQSIDISVLKKELKNRRLACNSECAIMERNQRLALALEIKNPDLSSKLGNPTYSQFLKDYARQNPMFVAGIEKAMSELVTAASQPKVNRKVHSFKSMPSSQRRVIHELAESYGCQTESYDEEPNKNVVATAIRDKCWLPNVTLTALVQRELFPKAPMPIPITSKEADIKSAAKAAKHSTQVYTDAKPPTTTAASVPAKRPTQPYVDYFDVTN